MSPGVARQHKAFDFDIVYVKNLSVMQQNLFIKYCHLRQLVEAIYDFEANLARQIAVFRLAGIQRRVLKQSGAVRLDRVHVVSVLMGDENVLYGLGVNAQPAHLFRKAVIVVSRVYMVVSPFL